MYNIYSLLIQILHPTLLDVVDNKLVLDHMNDDFARQVFSEDVECEMTALGHHETAKFVRCIRNALIVAADEGGLSASDRCRHLLQLDRYSLQIVLHYTAVYKHSAIMNSMQTCNSVTFYFMKNSFSDVSRKWILPNMIRAGTALIIFDNIHFLLTSENEFFFSS